MSIQPFQPFYPLRKLKKRRPSLGPLRGGANIGRPNRSQLSAQPQIQRGGGRKELGGGSSITTGPEQTPPEEQGLLGGLLAAKGSYEGGKEALQGGRNLRKKFNEFDFQQDVTDPMERDFSRMTGGRASDGNLSRQLSNPEFNGGVRGGLIGGRPPVEDGAFLNAKGLTSSSGPAPVNNISQMQSMSPPSGIDSAPQFSNGTQVAQGSNLSTGASGIFGSGAGGVQSAAGGLSKVPVGAAANNLNISAGAGGGLQVGANAGNSVNAGGAAATATTNSAGTAASGAGAGVGAMPYISGALSVYDMAENGVNAGNAMALAGTIALANSWNPVGWALMAGSAAYSIFG